jgi:hypothetical protein
VSTHLLIGGVGDVEAPASIAADQHGAFDIDG